MKILEQALDKINTINKKQRDFFTVLIQGMIGIAGKRTFRNLARYMQLAEHTFSRQMAKAFDFISLNATMLKAIKLTEGDIFLASQDASFLKKSGKSTHGLGYFWNGSAGKAEKGLEIDEIAIIRIGANKKEGYHLSAKQTPATSKSSKKNKKVTDPTRIDFYLNHVKCAITKIIEIGVKLMVVDAFFAKIKYVDGIISLGLHVVSKLRMDARLRRPYNGQQKARGRKKKFDDGKVGFDDFKDSIVIKLDEENTELRSCKVFSISLKRMIKVVLIRRYETQEIYGDAFLFSTDLELDALKIYQFYVARFQIEFIFRDAKGFTGLNDFQTREKCRINFHINASLTALNVAKLQDDKMQQNLGVQHAFSMTNWARKYHVAIVVNRIIAMFGLDQTSIKSHPDYEALLSFGNITH